MLELFLEGLKVTIFAMAIVFVVLTILMYIIKLQTICLKNVGDKEKVKNIDEEIIRTSEIDEISLENDKEIVAAIAAALAMYMDTPVNSINIKSIKKIKNSLDWRKSGIKSINV
ncbi:oxaloacetate decarboxylase gamma chain [Clostridium liquoris]|jgi:sodium pump decarboxylase gamma subunit|uniref:Oxaloacetate decarboxylase gamma chain n=1 Tax=Clostridium liquoris TaxID=1289519 RepID=A0A2T0AZK6_9CLOT|nr:OadG family protein [Clostridium liquoris]PRR76641.1 oxaloacetate decarboxylase gamma chain [Clostridium liquoris]